MLHGEPGVRARKGQACQTGSVCVSRGVAPPEWAVSQRRSGAGRPALLGGAFWTNIPLSAILLSCFVESIMVFPRLLHGDGLLSRLFSSQAISESWAVGIISDCYVFISYSWRYIQRDTRAQNKELIFKMLFIPMHEARCLEGCLVRVAG